MAKNKLGLTVADIKCHISLHKNLDHISIDPYVDDALKMDIIPCVGKELIDAYCAEPDLPKHKKIKPYLEAAVSWFAKYRLLPQHVAQLGDAGIQVTSTEKSVQAPQWSYKELLWQTCDYAYDHLECLIWECICPNLADFPSGAKCCCSFFLYSPSKFMQHYPLATPGAMRAWLALRPFMKRIERQCIKPVLCPEFFAAFKALVCSGQELTDIEEELACIIGDIIATQSVLLATPALNLRITADGAKIFERSDNMNKRRAGGYRDHEHAYHMQTGQLKTICAELVAFLAANGSEFPLYAQSACSPSSAADEDNKSNCGCQQMPCLCKKNPAGGPVIDGGSAVAIC